MKLKTMKAVFCTAYGLPEVLEIRDCPVPQISNKEILVKVLASSSTSADSFMRQGKPKFTRLFLGWKKPKNSSMGTGFSGEIVELGNEVSSFHVGDQIFGETIFGFGTNAEYVKISESTLALSKPNELLHVECATICDGFLTSYSFLKDIGNLQKGQRILINGASGSLGSAAVQIAKYMGAYVVGVCSSKNKQMVLSLGADEIIDYNSIDFTKLNHSFDLVYDTVGKSSFLACKKILTKHGKYLSPVFNISLLIFGIYTRLFSKKKALFSATGLKPISMLRPKLKDLTQLLVQKEIQVFIDKVYPLKDIVKAHQYIDTGHKKGNVVIGTND